MKLERESSNGTEGLVTAQAPRSAAAEAYRTLRTNIQFSSLDRPVRSLLIASAGSNEGKSTFVANLAIVMAESERRVILVDCDLRRPELHSLFGLPESPGLTTMILDEQVEPPLQETMVAGLSLLASGPLPPNPAELLASDRMARLITRLTERADIVLFDSSPVAIVSDAAALAARVDAVLLVVSSGRTRRGLAEQAKEQLERVGARLLGGVLINVKSGRASDEYHGGR